MNGGTSVLCKFSGFPFNSLLRGLRSSHSSFITHWSSHLHLSPTIRTKRFTIEASPTSSLMVSLAICTFSIAPLPLFFAPYFQDEFLRSIVSLSSIHITRQRPPWVGVLWLQSSSASTSSDSLYPSLLCVTIYQSCSSFPKRRMMKIMARDSARWDDR